MSEAFQVPAPGGHIAHTTHATTEAIAFFKSFFTVKSRLAPPHRDVERFINDHFHAERAVYFDGTLGFGISQPGLVEIERQFTAHFGVGAVSYATRVLGDASSAVVFLVDTPEMFGAELRAVAAVSLKDGRIVRNVDYWDGRRNAVINMRAPEERFADILGEDAVEETATDGIKAIVKELHDALASGNGQAAAAAFTDDAIFEDMTTRARIEGKIAIGRYLERALAGLPYGPGSSVRLTLGNDVAGGYEWKTAGKAVRNGITGLELQDGKISRFTTVWDGSRLSDQELLDLVTKVIEP